MPDRSCTEGPCAEGRSRRGSIAAAAWRPQGLADNATLWRRYRGTRDREAREELARRFLPLAFDLASRYSGRGEQPEDLAQVASLGLVKAIDGFEPERGVSFRSYAVPTILGELKRHFRDRCWPVHVPRDLRDRIPRINAVSERLALDLGRSPSVREIAAELGIGRDDVLESQGAAMAARTAPLHALDEDAGEVIPLAERIGEPDPRYEAVEDGAAIEGRLRSLSRRDRIVLHLRFREDLTQTEIARRVGLSQMHVSRILRRALGRLRD